MPEANGRDEVVFLLRMLGRIDVSTHQAVRSALNSLGGTLPPDHPAKQAQTAEDRSSDWLQRRSRPRVLSPPILPIQDVQQWLGAHANTRTNFIALCSQDFDNQLVALQEILRIISTEPWPEVPGSVIVRALSTVYPGVSAALYFPPEYDPRNPAAALAVEVTTSGNIRVFEVTSGTLIDSLIELLQQTAGS